MVGELLMKNDELIIRLRGKGVPHNGLASHLRFTLCSRNWDKLRLTVIFLNIH